MKKIRLFILMVFSAAYMTSCGQQQQNMKSLPGFRSWVAGIVEDSTHYWSHYPQPPKVTDSILLAMQREIQGDDSLGFYLEKLSRLNFTSAMDYEKAFMYINKMDYDYILLVLTVHWSPDTRVMAVRHLNHKLSIRPLINSRKMKNGEWQRFDRLATEFLLYVLDSNPLFISGSENATIHGIYISSITWALDLLTRKNITGKKELREWYKNDLQYEQAVLRWKSHIK